MVERLITSLIRCQIFPFLHECLVDVVFCKAHFILIVNRFSLVCNYCFLLNETVFLLSCFRRSCCCCWFLPMILNCLLTAPDDGICKQAVHVEEL